MQEIPIIQGFTAGELTPWLAARFDLQAYQRGAAEITNFQILPYGGIQNRPGTTYVKTLTSNLVRLFPFYYAEHDALMLEFFPGGMHVYKDGTQLMGSDGQPYVLTTPWTSANELASLHFNQINDAVYVCCSTYPLVVLYRYTDTQWKCVEPTFESIPRETYAVQSGALSVDFERGGLYAQLTLDGGDRQFEASMANTEVILADATIPSRTLFSNQTQAVTARETLDIGVTSVMKDTTWYQTDTESSMHYFYRCIRTYPVSAFNGSKKLSDYPHYFQPGIMRLDSGLVPYEVEGDWELTTNGTWNGHWELWRSYDTPDDEPDFYLWNWTCIRSFSQSDYETRQNWAISGSEPRPCRMVLVCRCSTDATVLGAMVQFKILGGIREYRLQITSVTDATHARARVLQTYLGSPVSFYTRQWSFCAIGNKNGYPAFSAFFQGRLWLGGIPGLPTTLLASEIDNFRAFRVGSNDDSAMHLSLMDSDQSRICWICAARELLVGTSDSEWVLTSGNGGALTASSVSFRHQSSVGSECLPARTVEKTMIFVQRGGKRLREMSYRLEADGFSATDISMLAEHLFTSGIKEWCVQRGANFNVWVLMHDSSVAMLTINQDQQVTAWQRVRFAGRKVLAMAALQNSTGKDDDVWFVMQVESSQKIVLERMCEDSLHLDSMEEVVAERDMELKCSYHLAGTELRVIDTETEQYFSCIGTAAGLRALPSIKTGKLYRVGIPIIAELQTMPLEGNISFNSVRQFSRFKLRMLMSDTDFEFRSTANETWERLPGNYYPDVKHPFTGALRLTQMPDAAVGQAFCIRYKGHHDFRLLAITQEVDHHGK